MTPFKCISLILLALTTTSVVAQSSTSNIQGVKKAPGATRNWSARVDTTVSRDLLKTSEAGHYSGMYNSFRFNIITDKGSFAAKTTVSKDFVDERKSRISDTSVSFTRKASQPFDGVVSFGTASLKLPTSKVSRKYSKLQAGISLSEGLSIADSVIGIKDLSALVILGASKNFHEYETTMTGSSNTSYSLSSVAYLTYSVSDALYLSLGGTYMKGWTYQNNTKDAYSFSQAIGYSFGPKYNLEVGHEFGGTPLSPDGKKVVIDLFDERDSSVYASLTIKI
ncbi:hypothetical protein ABMA70_00205 [Halobacteriovorax sp. XZX-3]|uniref:hypothetical protein n=1 Tax=unclassified Halobacteriovorax TaxID=2639665 RepID=UPI00370F9A21